MCLRRGWRCCLQRRRSCWWNGGPTTAASPYERGRRFSVMTGFGFGSPWLLALAALVPFIWWARARSRTHLHPRVLNGAMWLRTVAFVMLVIAIAQPVWHAATRDVSVIYAL